MSNIPFIVWQNEFSVGHDKLDVQHKNVITIINSLFQVLHENQGPEMQWRVLNELRQHTETHLAFEEEIMEKIGFPHLAIHQAQHKSYTREVEIFIVKSQGGLDVSVDLLHFLKKWWLNHVVNVDQAYAPFIKRHFRDNPPNPDYQNHGA